MLTPNESPLLTPLLSIHSIDSSKQSMSEYSYVDPIQYTAMQKKGSNSNSRNKTRSNKYSLLMLEA